MPKIHEIFEGYGLSNPKPKPETNKSNRTWQWAETKDIFRLPDQKRVMAKNGPVAEQSTENLPQRIHAGPSPDLRPQAVHRRRIFYLDHREGPVKKMGVRCFYSHFGGLPVPGLAVLAQVRDFLAEFLDSDNLGKSLKFFINLRG